MLINCSYPNYNLAIEKMKVYYGAKAKEVRSVSECILFNTVVDHFDGVCLSVIFSWDVTIAIREAKEALKYNKQVMIGGGGSFYLRHLIKSETGIDAVYRPVDELENVDGNFKMVYFVRGCDVGCWFCTVPKIEGLKYVLNKKSNPSKVLMDNNLSLEPINYQEHTVEKYLSAGISSVDCNSGFEPKGINDYVVKLWSNLPLRWWRLGFDVIDEENQVLEAIRVIKSVSKKTIRVYTMIGHEPMEQCRYRCEKVISMGCEPVPQSYIKLNSIEKKPEILHDWTEEKLRWFQRFFYRPELWRKMKLTDYVPKVDGVRPFA